MPVHDLLLVKLLNILLDDPMFSEETQRELRSLLNAALGGQKDGE